MISIWIFVGACVLCIVTNLAWYRMQMRALKNNDEAIAMIRGLVERDRESDEP